MNVPSSVMHLTTTHSALALINKIWLDLAENSSRCPRSSKNHKQELQSDRALNKRILEKVVAANNFQAVKLRSTIFAKDILHRDEGETIL